MTTTIFPTAAPLTITMETKPLIQNLFENTHSASALSWGKICSIKKVHHRNRTNSATLCCDGIAARNCRTHVASNCLMEVLLVGQPLALMSRMLIWRWMHQQAKRNFPFITRVLVGYAMNVITVVVILVVASGSPSSY